MEQEFDNHSEHSKTYEDFTDSNNAFDIINMLRAFPTYEYSISQYSKHQYGIGNENPYREEIERQKEFYKKVVDYAQLIIDSIKLK